MIFRPFYSCDRGCAAYVFGCGTLSRCAVVDPRAEDVDSYVEFAATTNMQITHVIDTHVHADHYSGGSELSRSADASYCLHAAWVCPYYSFAKRIHT
jgi:glyoxylase-like metal-dependent hydrolase (beta-lactamase superfamily II)